MTIEQGAAHLAVKIRVHRSAWLWRFVGAVFLVVFGVLAVMDDRPWNGIFRLVVGCLLGAEALWFRTFGLDLTPEFAKCRGFNRRSIPWHHVQAVVRYRELGKWMVRLVLENGERVDLRAPTRLWRFGGAAYERDFHRIGQYWLAHRGESWRPVRPEAHRLAFPE